MSSKKRSSSKQRSHYVAVKPYWEWSDEQLQLGYEEAKEAFAQRPSEDNKQYLALLEKEMIERGLMSFKSTKLK